MTGTAASTPEDAGQRILAAAFTLFGERGLLDVSVEDILTKAHASRSTFYQRFDSKEKVVVAFLEHGLKNLGVLIEGAKTEEGWTAVDSLLAVFDFFDEWSRWSVVALSSILRILNEFEPTDPLRQSVVEFLDRSRDRVAAVAAEAGLKDPVEFARSFQIVTRGALIAAVEGDAGAAARARNMAAKLIALHTPPGAGNPGCEGSRLPAPARGSSRWPPGALPLESVHDGLRAASDCSPPNAGRGPA